MYDRSFLRHNARACLIRCTGEYYPLMHCHLSLSWSSLKPKGSFIILPYTQLCILVHRHMWHLLQRGWTTRAMHACLSIITGNFVDPTRACTIMYLGVHGIRKRNSRHVTVMHGWCMVIHDVWNTKIILFSNMWSTLHTFLNLLINSTYY